MQTQFFFTSIALAPPLVRRPYAPYIVHTHILRHWLGWREGGGVWQFYTWLYKDVLPFSLTDLYIFPSFIYIYNIYLGGKKHEAGPTFCGLVPLAAWRCCCRRRWRLLPRRQAHITLLHPSKASVKWPALGPHCPGDTHIHTNNTHIHQKHQKHTCQE